MALNISIEAGIGGLNGSGEPPPPTQQQSMKQILESVHSELPSYEDVAAQGYKDFLLPCCETFLGLRIFKKIL